jgi:hypothetical protein
MTRSRGILPPRNFWTDAEIALLRAMYPDCAGDDVAAWIGRDVRCVYAKAKALGLSKSPEFMASDASGRVRRGKQHPSMIASQFKRGHTTWNKGRPSAETGTGHHPNSRRTQFRKGRKAEESRNYVPLGSHRICADGYLERKVTDDPRIVPARRWVAVHRLVWEAERGPIPPGHIVRFKEGQKTAVLELITADRLECITRGEHAQRNHPRSRSPELARLVQLKGAITRQVNRITREAQRTA